MNGKGIIGLGEVLYELLGGLSIVCAACCLFLSIRPSAFFAEFLLSTGLVLKGTWVLQVGFSVFTDTFAFKGCERVPFYVAKGETNIKCELDEDKFRGVALVNLMFVGHVIAVLITSLVLSGLLCRHQNRRSNEASGSLLAGLDPESTVIRSLPEFEIE